MGSVATQWRDGLKFVVAVAATALGVTLVNRLGWSALGSEALTATTVGIVTSLATWLLMDIALGQVKLELEWEVSGLVTPSNFPVLHADEGEKITLGVVLRQRRQTGLSRAVGFALRAHSLCVEVRFRPSDSLRLTPQKWSDSVRFSPGLIEFDLKDGTWQGERGWAEVFAHRLTQIREGHEVTIHTKILTSSRLRFVLPLAIRCDGGVNGFVVRSHSGGIY